MNIETDTKDLGATFVMGQAGGTTIDGPWLLQAGGPGVAVSRSLKAGESLVIGNRKESQWKIEDSAVSAEHVMLSSGREGLVLSDLNSTNGTYVGGARVQSAVLPTEGGSFAIGRTTVSISPMKPQAAASPFRAIPELLGHSEPMRRLAASIVKVAPLNVPVLIQGESGTGKDVVARALHSLSGRTGRYVAVNAGALSETLADSELFGHRRGAFTGAVQTHAGAFEQADKGSLFLDEVADLSAAVQVKMLRAVESGEVRQLGGTVPLRVRTRIIAATWAPLEECVAQGRFRADLYHRISTFVIQVPPLRQRKSDIPILARSLFLSQKDQLGPKFLSPAALTRLSSHNFPGNVRELFAILYRASVASDSPEVGPLEVDAAIPRVSLASARPAAVDAEQILAAHEGNVSAAARSAQVARSTFRSWLKRTRGQERAADNGSSP